MLPYLLSAPCDSRLTAAEPDQFLTIRFAAGSQKAYIPESYGHHNQTVKEGKWAKCPDWCYWDYPMIELYGKTAGIIGLGRIGQATAKLLNALEMRVVAYDAYESDAGRKLAEYVDLDTLFAASDVIFLHCPLLPSTAGIINKANIEKMKDGVIIINNSRGQLIVEEDL